MDTTHHCQSCSMPIETEDLKGNEKDGQKNPYYCVYCYDNGSWTHPELTLEDMKFIVRDKMEEMHLPPDLKFEMIELSQKMLPTLRRWSD